ncbi:MAG TPA: CBS domain-containing protein [Caldilineae bacterium]|nr:CBS domain-containing protein [Caldilineae bacterium]
MLVKDCMTRHPIMISPETPAAEAQKIMAENQIRHLPVVGSGKRLLGLITRQRLSLKPDELGSLNIWEISRRLSAMTAKKIMLKAEHVQTIIPDKTVERAARIMTDHKVGCLPVLEDGIVVGILTETDLLKSFQTMLGLPADGVRVTVRMPGGVGIFKQVIVAISEEGWPILGLGSFPTRKQPGYWDSVFKIAGVNIDEVEAVINQVPNQEIVDIREVV